MINVKVDDRQVRLMVRSLGKGAAMAGARALNSTAFAVLHEGRKRITGAFDKPTNWTVKSWYVRKKAKKNDLLAVTGWSDYLSNKQGKGADYFLAQHWNGGQRNLKRFEERLSRKGVLPAGMQAVPGKAAEEMGMIDARGNMKGSVIVAILSALQMFSEAGFNMNANGRRKASKRAARHVYWAGKPGPNTPNGIWALDEKFRRGRGRLRPVIIFVKRGTYRKRLDLNEIADAVVMKTFRAELAKEIYAQMQYARMSR